MTTSSSPSASSRGRAGWRPAALCLAVLLLACLSGSAFAQKADVPQYRLVAGDRIAVVVMGQPELSGTFAVDSAGHIVVPLLSPISVEGDTIAECQSKIREGLANGFLRQPAVFARLDEVRPINVLGDVNNPGSYKYQSSSIAKTAIAQAGGYLSTARAMDATSEFFAAEERLASLAAKRDSAFIRKARLEAQLAGEKTFAAPDLTMITRSQAAPIIAAERRMLGARIEAFSSQRDLLRTQKPELSSEYAAIKGQIRAEEDLLGLLRERVSVYTSLKAKGLARSSELFELEISMAGKQSNAWRLEAEASKLRLAINDLDVKLRQVEDNFKELTLTELGNVQQQIFEIDTALPSAREMRAARLQTLGRSTAATTPGYSIRITRSRGREATTMLEASETSPLEPGDIVEVRALRPRTDAPTE